MTPARVAEPFRRTLSEKGPPPGFPRFRQRKHIRLHRQFVRFPCVTLDTGTDHILPGGRATFLSWNDMVQVQVAILIAIATVLAGELVPFKNTLPAEFHLLPGNSVIRRENNDRRHPKLVGNRSNHIFTPVIH